MGSYPSFMTLNVQDHRDDEAMRFGKQYRCWGCGADEERELRGFAVGTVDEWSNVVLFLRLHEPMARSMLAMGPRLVSIDIPSPV